MGASGSFGERVGGRAGRFERAPPGRRGLSTNERERTMSEASVVSEPSLDELGPVDYVVVEFPAGASNFTGEMAAELLALVDAGTIRVIDRSEEHTSELQ